MPFQPGPSGNPRGQPKGSCNKTRRAVREWATGIVEDPQVQARLLADARTGKLHPSVLTVLMTYVYGRPNPRDVPEPETAITIERARISYAAGGKQYLAVPVGTGGASWTSQIPPQLTPEKRRPIGVNEIFVFALPDSP